MPVYIAADRLFWYKQIANVRVDLEENLLYVIKGYKKLYDIEISLGYSAC